MANLFYVIGASGAGKDSLIQYVRDHLPAHSPIVFAHRYITRPADAGGENHVALSEAEFVRRDSENCFAMNWFSHDTHYGVGIEVNEWLARGFSVVLNGSRGYLDEAALRFSNLVPVLISVNPDVLYDRLHARGRETELQINKRLKQAVELEQGVNHPALIKIENNRTLDDAGENLLHILLSVVEDKCA